ncbi:MAG: riboflavin synthase [Gammaproteobacteria bacterium]|nr:riboflavin synthase [Gammaproteobacteria bacterium]
MFCGIVEKIGFVTHIENDQACKHFTISTVEPFNHLIIGESIAVNGVCLTVTNFTEQSFNVTAVPETLRLTNLNFLSINQTVNLERAMTACSRIGGHFVQGHVDCVGEIQAIEADHSQALLVKIKLPRAFAKYLINKGYIALDGMSITIIEAAEDSFTITFIPHTQENTITKHYVLGSRINIEVDILGKYIEKFLHTRGLLHHANSI